MTKKPLGRGLSALLSTDSWPADNEEIRDIEIDLIRPSTQQPRTTFDETKLEELALGGSKLTDAGLVHLKGATSLTCLGLDGTTVTDQGLENLKGLVNLDCLHLDRTVVSDAGLQHLVGMTKLRTLTVSETKVTPQGVKSLQQVLPKVQITR